MERRQLRLDGIHPQFNVRGNIYPFLSRIHFSTDRNNIVSSGICIYGHMCYRNIYAVQRTARTNVCVCVRTSGISERGNASERWNARKWMRTSERVKENDPCCKCNDSCLFNAWDVYFLLCRLKMCVVRAYSVVDSVISQDHYNYTPFLIRVKRWK